MKTIKKAFKDRINRIYKLALVIVAASILTVSLFFGVLLTNSKSENISLKTDKFINAFSELISELDESFNPLVKSILEKEYEKSFNDATISNIKNTLMAYQSDKFNVESVNYYRVSKNFFVYDTDYLSDLGLDFSPSEYFEKNLASLKPGEIFQDKLVSEKKTGQLRNYSYIKLDDDSYFEIAVSFSGIDEIVQSLAHEVFQNDDVSIHIAGHYSKAKEKLFHESRKSGKSIFKMVNLLISRYYVSQTVNHHVYNIMITIPFTAPLFILIFSFSMLFVLFVLFNTIRNIIKKLSEKIGSEIEIVESNMKNFSLVKRLSEPQTIESNIYEIDSISQSFSQLHNEIYNSYDELNAMNEELEESYQKNKNLLEQLEKVLDMPDYLKYIDDLDAFLLMCFRKVSSFISKSDYAYVVIAEEGEFKFLDGKGFDLNKVKNLTIKVEERDRKGRLFLKDYTEKDKYIIRNPLIKYEPELRKIQQGLSIPVSTANRYYGNITFFSKKLSGSFTDDDLKVATYFYKYLRGYLMLRELSQLESDIQKETIHAMIRILEKHDSYTKGHSEAVAKLSSEFAQFLGFDKKKVQDIYWAGIVHDSGKILIPNTVLNKPKRLTEDEFNLIKKHPVYAYDVLKDSKNLKDVALYIKHHHEWFNGRGYPDKLSGEDIPIESRLLAIADSWDAMISDRVYKRGISEKEAINEINRFSGTQFDPELVSKWNQFIEERNLTALIEEQQIS